MTVHIAEPQSAVTPARPFAKPQLVENCSCHDAPKVPIQPGGDRTDAVGTGFSAFEIGGSGAARLRPFAAIATREAIAAGRGGGSREMGPCVAGLGAVCKDSATWIAEHRPSVGARSLPKNSAFLTLPGARERARTVARCQS